MNSLQNKKPAARQADERIKLLDALRKSPIVQIACQQAEVARATYYRWRKEDPDFAAACDDALSEGAELVSDMAESKLISAIKDQNFSAISFWLRNRHPAYADRLRIQAKIDQDRPLTPEQEELVRRSIELATAPNPQLPDGHGPDAAGDPKT
jgi:hypothetical protein